MFRRSIVFRLDSATSIEKSPKIGITWSITSSADGFALPVPSVGLNLKIKRLMGNHEFPRRKSPKGAYVMGKNLPSLLMGLIRIALVGDHGKNALYALLDKDRFCLLVGQLR